MQLEIRREGDHAIARPLVQRLDAEVSLEFKEQMVRLIEEGPTAIVLHLGDVEFVDSSGLGAIVTVLKSMPPARKLLVCNIDEAVLSMFRLTHMDKVFSMHATLADALSVITV